MGIYKFYKKAGVCEYCGEPKGADHFCIKKRKLTKGEKLALEGKRFVSFVVDKTVFACWVARCKDSGITPNERFNFIINIDEVDTFKDEQP